MDKDVLQTTNQLLSQARQVFRHQQERRASLGEDFNVFSILKMESKENGTHSAFLGELLNPKGRHGQKGRYLRLFLEMLAEADWALSKHLDADTATLVLEHSIGKIKGEGKAGGRIDLYLKDGRGHSLSIENKIYAGDQETQLERYCNYDRANNRVVYLTLEGKDAAAKSRGRLQAGKDYLLLSYREHIAQWLEACLRTSYDQPMIRENLKQYHLLIQKLTHTMDKPHEKELTDLMFKHFEEAQYIARSFRKACQRLVEDIRLEVVETLKEELDAARYRVERGTAVTAEKKYSQIWLHLKGYEPCHMFIGIESFTETVDYVMFVGVYNHVDKSKKKKRGYGLQNYDKANNAYWINRKSLPSFEGHRVHFGNGELVALLYRNADGIRGRFVRHLVNEVKLYLEAELEGLLRQLDSEMATV